VVEVEVREHDVAHVGGLVAQRFDLPHRRHLFAKVGAQQREEKAAQAAARVGHVTQPKPVSTSTRPSFDSTSRQWQHNCPR
jgi:hypothetical protein